MRVGGPLKSEERSRRRNKVGRYKFWLATSKALITHSHLLTPRGEDSRYCTTAAGSCTWATYVHLSLSPSVSVCLFFHPSLHICRCVCPCWSSRFNVRNSYFLNAIRKLERICIKLILCSAFGILRSGSVLF